MPTRKLNTSQRQSLTLTCSGSCGLPVPEEEPVQYRVETLALFILGPVVVLVVLSVVSVLACKRLHHGRLQRLQEFDTEQGTVDGLITSNVGDSTLAVSMEPSGLRNGIVGIKPFNAFASTSFLKYMVIYC